MSTAVRRNVTIRRMLHELVPLAKGLKGTLELGGLEDGKWFAMIVPKQGAAVVGRADAPDAALRALWDEVERLKDGSR